MASLFARRGSGGCDLVNFPEEIKFKILKYLSFSDLKSVIAVCRAWRLMGENPYLWRDFELIVWTEVANIYYLLTISMYISAYLPIYISRLTWTATISTWRAGVCWARRCWRSGCRG